MTEEPQGNAAVAGQLERGVRPAVPKRGLVERLRDDAQGEDLGADGMGWSPDPALKREAADEIERLRAMHDCDEERTECDCAKPQDNDRRVCMACGCWIAYRSRA
jgi:hypothetical protein